MSSGEEDEVERRPVKRIAHLENRRSVWDYVHGIVTKHGKAPINRLCFVANFTSKLANKKDLTKYYEQFWSRQNTEALGPISGISLVLPSSTIHLVEAHPKIISELLRDLGPPESRGTDAFQQKLAKNAAKAIKPETAPIAARAAGGSQMAGLQGLRGEQLMKDIRVVAMTEDVVDRAWPTWECRVLQVGRAIELGGDTSTSIAVEVPEDDGDDAGQALASQVYFSLMKLGRSLAEIEKPQYEAALDNLRGSAQYKDLVPSADVISSIIACKDVFTIDEFLAVYDGPVNIDLDTEQTWTLS